MGSPGAGLAIPDRRLEIEPGVPIIAREGWPIVAAFGLGTAIAWIGGVWVIGWPGHIGGGIGLLLTLWSMWFFRDPKRTVPSEPGLIISPADGVICHAGPARPPPELDVPDDLAGAMTRVSIFMNVFNVHVNRFPADAIVESMHYRPGKFFNASLDKASEHNERCALRLRTADGVLLACVQIAGLIARRIVCKVGAGDRLLAGQRFGLIRFGSRVDVYLPPGIRPLVAVNDRSVAGETIIARLSPTPAQENP